MRTLVFFDLPTDTLADKREYVKFRKFLIKDGFIMLQFSVYVKLAVNKTVAESVKNGIKRHKPARGSVGVMEITENQFANIEWILGKRRSDVLDTTDRVTIFDDDGCRANVKERTKNENNYSQSRV